MLLLEDPYLYLMMFSAMAVGFVGIRIVRRRRATTACSPASRSAGRPSGRGRNHIAGAAIFGLGWAITDSCPAPIAAQLAQGVLWAVPTIAGVLVGIELFFRRVREQPAAACRSARCRSRRAARPSPVRGRRRGSDARRG